MILNIRKAKDFFNFLVGNWNIDREIISNIEAENIKAKGYAKFTLAENNENHIYYSENLNIFLPANILSHIKAEQKYQYKYQNKKLYKYFSDNRFFCLLDINQNNQASGLHICNKDYYNINYILKEENSFLLIYDISGPLKSCKIISFYNRIK